MSPEDIKTTKENHKLLALTEHPTWGVFVQMVDTDLNQLDKISSLIVEGKTKEQIADEVLLRYQTRDTIITYVNDVITRAESALDERTEETNDIIKRHNP